jgi:predicted TIM-barrel fold metal-dependent hydrolase
MIVDFHTHIYPRSLREQRESYVARDRTFGELFTDPRAKMATAEELVAAMDEDGVDRSVVMGIGWTDQGVAREANDYLVDAVRRFPDRLTGFVGVNPAWGGEASALEAERCARAGLRGIGELHPTSQGYDLGSESIMSPLMEVVREHGLIVTTHSSEPVGHTYRGKGDTRPEMLWRFITQYPDITLVCAHWGGGLPFYALMPEVAEALGNVYFDTAASPFLYDARVFDVVAGLVGPEKILLGSDYPLLRASRLTRQVHESDLSDADRSAILGGNAARLLGL